MNSFAKARTNMVDGQIHPHGIIMPELLEAYETIPRERFVPAHLQNIAYSDEDIDLGNGRFLLEPISHARMVQALEPKEDDVVLDIGGTMGYSSAIFSNLVSTVIAIEEQEDFLLSANILWEELGLYNITSLAGPLTKGCPEHAPYDVIFLNGSVSEVPVNLAQQLCSGGRMICVVRENGQSIGHATVVQNLGDGQISSYSLFEVGCPYIIGFEPRPVFKF